MRVARCDECAKEAKVDRWCSAPNEWFEVEQESDDFEDRLWLFCSAPCLASYFVFRCLPEPWETEESA